jgi:asparagine synthase (glutamine-hydrolysing)
MCGICGVIGNPSKEESEAIVRRMMTAIVHRGPDEEGVFLAPRVAAGTRRLSIIDLAGGSQPVWNEAKTLAIVFNGEIYNFRDLRRELESRGHRFHTNSDTEVVVQAYEAWGRQCLDRLRGMFAFAVIEMPDGPAGRATQVFIARDPLGIKPLYYAMAEGAFLFASEIRALLASGCVAARLSHEAVPSYLLFGSVSEPTTLVEGVVSLPPGHSLTIPIDERLQLPEPYSYWDFGEHAASLAAENRASLGHSGSPAEHVRALLEDAIRSHLIADVPVGVFLSGGIDSTAIAALASRAQRGIHTFTVAFPDTEFSEAEIARRTAKRLGSEHSELTLTHQDMLARIDEAVASFDQPSMDGINTYFVSWAARQAGLKVALSGLGSDELFGGYTSFRATARIAQLSKIAQFAPRQVRSLAIVALKASGAFPGSPDQFRKASAAWLDPTLLPHLYFFTRALFTPQAVSSATRKDPASWYGMAWWGWLSGAAREASSMDRFTGTSWLELRSYLANTLLRDTDAMSMRHSLEVRVPFLDRPLVEYVLSLPESAKRNPARPKALLIDALGDLLPQEIVTQRKRTFTFPWDNWLRGELGQRVAAGLADWSPALAPQIDAAFARTVWQNFQGRRTTWSRPWSLYVLNEWVKRNLRADVAGGEGRQSAAVVSAA